MRWPWTRKPVGVVVCRGPVLDVAEVGRAVAQQWAKDRAFG